MVRGILRIIALLAVAFVTTSALMFWIAFLDRAGYTDLGGWVPYEYIDTATPDFRAYSQEEIRRRASIEEKESIDKVFASFSEKNTAELLKLKAAEENVCHAQIDCYSLPVATIRRIVESALTERQFARDAQTAQSAHTANVIAAGSLFIALLSMTIAGLTYFKAAWNSKDVKR